MKCLEYILALLEDVFVENQNVLIPSLSRGLNIAFVIGNQGVTQT